MVNYEQVKLLKVSDGFKHSKCQTSPTLKQNTIKSIQNDLMSSAVRLLYHNRLKFSLLQRNIIMHFLLLGVINNVRYYHMMKFQLDSEKFI